MHTSWEFIVEWAPIGSFSVSYFGMHTSWEFIVEWAQIGSFAVSYFGMHTSWEFIVEWAQIGSFSVSYFDCHISWQFKVCLFCAYSKVMVAAMAGHCLTWNLMNKMLQKSSYLKTFGALKRKLGPNFLYMNLYKACV
jgi:hypothetical protein